MPGGAPWSNDCLGRVVWKLFAQASDDGLASASSRTITSGNSWSTNYDAASKQLVLTGRATKTLRLEQESREKNSVNKAIAQLMKNTEFRASEGRGFSPAVPTPAT